jgi:hypothetical protein
MLLTHMLQAYCIACAQTDLWLRALCLLLWLQTQTFGRGRQEDADAHAFATFYLHVYTDLRPWPSRRCSRVPAGSVGRCGEGHQEVHRRAGGPQGRMCALCASSRNAHSYTWLRPVISGLA